MEVILLEKIRKLGALGDKVQVRPGYGRNYLIPNKKAVRATQANIEKFKSLRAEFEKAADQRFNEARARAEKLSGMTVTISAKASEEGKLYGSVGTREIAEAFTAKGVAVEKREVLLPLGALREVGEFDVQFVLHSDVSLELKVTVVAE